MNTKLGTLLKLLPIAKPNNVNSLLQNINSVLPELHAENFIYHAELLVIYGDLLYKAVSQEKGDTRNTEYLNQFYSRLRSIGKLSLSNDITTLAQAWKKFHAYCLSETDYTDIPQIDMFDYYFLKNRVNTLLADPTVCSRMVLQSLIPNRMHWIEEKNLERAILIAVRSLNKQKVQELLTYCENKQQPKLVELFWKYALQYGRCSIVEYLLKYQLALPDNIDDFKLTLRIAIRCDIKPIFAYILEKFSLLKILQYACDKGLYQITYICLLNLPVEGNLKNLSLVSELAAACGDMEVLKVFLSKCNNKERQTLYEQHILPNYVPTKGVTKNEAEQQKKEITDIYGDNQQIYELEFQRTVAIFLYYMKKGKFIFSMDTIPGCFTMVDCGDLRKEIACQCNTPFGDLFGVIRTHDSATQTKGKFDQYAKVTEKILAREGKVLPTGIPDVASLEYQVTAELANANVKLTVYRQTLYQAEKLADSIVWQHPSWLVFPQVLNYIQNIWLLIYQANKDNLSDDLLITALKKLPRILHKLGHGCIYFRGSASIAEKITSAICGFLHLDELRKYQQQMPDCVAIITPDEDEYVKIFPSIFGFNSYEEMLVTLKAGYLINVSRKESELNGLGNYLKEINDAEHKAIAQKTDDTVKTLVTEKIPEATLNHQKVAMQQTRLALSLNSLNEISENNINNIISEINVALTELTSNNFFKFGRQLVIYGTLLFNKTYNQKDEIINNGMHIALQNLYSHLRRIDKLRPNTDLLYLSKICKRTIAFIRTDLKIGYNLEKGSFAYFFSINYVNNLLSDKSFCRIKLLESLIPDRIDWIDEKNLDQTIMLAIKCSSEDIVQAFMLYFAGAKRIDILNIFMRYALQYGRCDTVEWLLEHKIAFPEKIQEVGLIFRLAVICRRNKIVSSLEEIFPLQIILNHCLLSQDYELSFFILNNLSDSIVTLYGLSFITGIAASCGDIAALKVFISKCPEVDRDKLFTQYIEPYYIPAKPLKTAKDDQDVFNQKFIRHVSIISYYMRINKFCFTLEPGEDGVFTLLDCGHLRKLIAYILKQNRYYEFGTVRSASLSTVLSNEYESYRKPTETLILQNGYEAQDEFLTLLPDLKARDFPICAQLPTGKVILTIMRKPFSLNQHDIYEPKWCHAKWTDFPNILKHIQNILIAFNAMRKEQHTHAMRIAALSLLVQIHYYFSPTCIYNRGSATVGEMIISGAAETIELDDLRKHQKMKPDCVSIITLTCEEYVENYPKIYGFKNYDEMVTTLHNEFMARMSRKEAELQELRLFIRNKCPVTQSSAINIISKLSTAEAKLPPVTAAAPTVNSKSNPELSAKLLSLNPIGDRQNSILFSNYMNLGEQDINRPFYRNSIEDLIKELCENGPFLVTGKYGQIFYTVNPGTVTHDFADQKMTVYGWAPNTFKENTTVDPQQVIVVGARKDGEKKYVYYIPIPISPAQQRYVISYARYKENLKQLVLKEEKKALPENNINSHFPK